MADREATDLKKVLAALSDPTRLRITECLWAGPLTAEVVARRLGMVTNRLYYHLRVLEDAGVIRVVDSVHEGRLPQRRYGLAEGARVWNEELPMSGDLDARATFFAAALRATADEARDAVLDDDRGLDAFSLSRQVIQTTPAAFHQLMDRIGELVADAWEAAGKPDAREYRLSVVGYQTNADCEADQ